MTSWEGWTGWENGVDESMEVGKGTPVTAAISQAGEKSSKYVKRGLGDVAGAGRGPATCHALSDL